MSTFYANLKKKLHFFIFFVVRQLSFKWYFKLRIELGFKTYHPGLSRFEKKTTPFQLMLSMLMLMILILMKFWANSLKESEIDFQQKFRLFEILFSHLVTSRLKLMILKPFKDIFPKKI